MGNIKYSDYYSEQIYFTKINDTVTVVDTYKKTFDNTMEYLKICSVQGCYNIYLNNSSTPIVVDYLNNNSDFEIKDFAINSIRIEKYNDSRVCTSIQYFVAR